MRTSHTPLPRPRSAPLLWGAALTLALGLAAASPASAQSTPNQVEAGVKGTIGLGLVGAELGFVVPTALGLDEAWSLIVFPVVGATGGALAGYFLIDQNDETEWAVASLALGLALVIPATVLTVKFTSYDPGDDVPPPETARSGGAAPRPVATAAPAPLRVADLRARSGLLRLGDGALALGVPALSVRTDLSLQESALYGVDATPELHLPVVSGAF